MCDPSDEPIVTSTDISRPPLDSENSRAETINRTDCESLPIDERLSTVDTSSFECFDQAKLQTYTDTNSG